MAAAEDPAQDPRAPPGGQAGAGGDSPGHHQGPGGTHPGAGGWS